MYILMYICTRRSPIRRNIIRTPKPIATPMN